MKGAVGAVVIEGLQKKALMKLLKPLLPINAAIMTLMIVTSMIAFIMIALIMVDAKGEDWVNRGSNAIK